MKLIGQEQLFGICEPLGVSINTPDEQYALPTQSWFFGEYAAALKNFYHHLGIEKYQAGSNDCEDFALIGLAFASILHARSTRANAGLAIAEIWYQIGGHPDQGHAILAAIVETNGRFEIVFMEPQNQTQIFLTHQELTSCLYVRFV